MKQRDSLIRTLKGLNNSLLHELANGLSKYWKASPTWIQDIIDLLDKIYGNPLYLEAHPDPNTEFLHLEDSVKVTLICVHADKKKHQLIDFFQKRELR